MDCEFWLKMYYKELWFGPTIVVNWWIWGEGGGENTAILGVSCKLQEYLQGKLKKIFTYFLILDSELIMS